MEELSSLQGNATTTMLKLLSHPDFDVPHESRVD